MDLTDLIIAILVLAAGFGVGALIVWLALRVVSGPRRKRPATKMRRLDGGTTEPGADTPVMPTPDATPEIPVAQEQTVPSGPPMPLSPMREKTAFGYGGDDEEILALRATYSEDYYGYGRAVAMLSSERTVEGDFAGAALASTEIPSEDQKCRVLTELASAALAVRDRKWQHYAEEAERIAVSLPELDDPWKDKNLPKPLLRWEAVHQLSKVYEEGGMPERAISVLAPLSQVALSHITIREIIGRSARATVQPVVETLLLDLRAELERGDTRARAMTGDREDLAVVRVTLCGTWAALGDLEQAQADFAQIPREREGLRSEAELAMSAATSRRPVAVPLAEPQTEIETEAEAEETEIAAGAETAKIAAAGGQRVASVTALPETARVPDMSPVKPVETPAPKAKEPAEPAKPEKKAAHAGPSAPAVKKPKRAAKAETAPEVAEKPADTAPEVAEKPSEAAPAAADEPAAPSKDREAAPATPPRAPDRPETKEEPLELVMPLQRTAEYTPRQTRTRFVPIEEIEEAVAAGQLSFAEYLTEIERDPRTQQAYRRDVARAYLDSGDIHDAHRMSKMLDSEPMREALDAEIERVEAGGDPPLTVGDVTAVVIGHDEGGNAEKQTYVRGFHDRDHALAWARRRVRASIEICRAPDMSADDLLKRWRDNGDDVTVDEERVCADRVEEWAKTPATPEETDYEALAPRLF